MKRIFINDSNLEINDINYDVIRVKALIINKNNEVILIENNNTFQFPGGHYKKNESLEIALAREIKEELGVDIDINYGPFMMITTFDNNYFNTGDKVCNKIYYFVLYSDIEPDLNNLHLDEFESKTSFKVFRVKVNELNNFLKRALDDGKIDSNIGREMLLVLDEFNKLYGGIK